MPKFFVYVLIQVFEGPTVTIFICILTLIFSKWRPKILNYIWLLITYLFKTQSTLFNRAIRFHIWKRKFMYHTNKQLEWLAIRQRHNQRPSKFENFEMQTFYFICQNRFLIIGLYWYTYLILFTSCIFRVHNIAEKKFSTLILRHVPPK